MTRVSMLLAGVALIGLTSAMPAVAESEDHSCSHRERMQQRFAEVDTDKDGKVSDQERKAAKDKRFKEIDRNRDGKVTEKEMEAHHQAREAERHKARFAEMDKDGNGTLSADELEGPKGDRFEKADANNDGYVTKEEMKKSRHERREGRHERWRHKERHKGETDCKVD